MSYYNDFNKRWLKYSKAPLIGQGLSGLSGLSGLQATPYKAPTFGGVTSDPAAGQTGSNDLQQDRPDTMQGWQSKIGGMSRLEKDQQYPGMHTDLIPAYEMITGGDPNWGMEGASNESVLYGQAGIVAQGWNPAGYSLPVSSARTPHATGAEEREAGSLASSDTFASASMPSGIPDNTGFYFPSGPGRRTPRLKTRTLMVNRRQNWQPFQGYRGPTRIWGTAKPFGDTPLSPIRLEIEYVNTKGKTKTVKSIFAYSVPFNFVAGKHPDPGMNSPRDQPMHVPRFSIVCSSRIAEQVQIEWSDKSQSPLKMSPYE